MFIWKSGPEKTLLVVHTKFWWAGSRELITVGSFQGMSSEHLIQQMSKTVNIYVLHSLCENEKNITYYAEIKINIRKIDQQFFVLISVSSSVVSKYLLEFSNGIKYFTSFSFPYIQFVSPPLVIFGDCHYIPKFICPIFNLQFSTVPFGIP